MLEQMVNLLVGIQAASVSPVDVDAILRISAETMNEWNPSIGNTSQAGEFTPLLSREDIGAAIASRVGKIIKIPRDHQDLFEATWAWGQAFANLLDSRPEQFAPRSKEFTSLKNTIADAYQRWMNVFRVAGYEWGIQQAEYDKEKSLKAFHQHVGKETSYGHAAWELGVWDGLLSTLNENFLSVTQIAERTNVGRQYVKDEIWCGNLPAQKIGSGYIVRPDDYQTWLANPKRGSRKQT